MILKYSPCKKLMKADFDLFWHKHIFQENVSTQKCFEVVSKINGMQMKNTFQLRANFICGSVEHSLYVFVYCRIEIRQISLTI